MLNLCEDHVEMALVFANSFDLSPKPLWEARWRVCVSSGYYNTIILLYYYNIILLYYFNIILLYYHIILLEYSVIVLSYF